MNYKHILICIALLLVMFSNLAAAENSNLNIDVYYNDELYPGASTPKPVLKIGEPFTLKFEVTCYKINSLSAMLTSIGNSDFDIIEGPTLRLGSATHGTIEANETRVFEWTVTPNEEWAGGRAPINFYYQMIDLDTRKTIAKGEFTAAYVTISEEYYDGPFTTAEPSGNSDSESTPATPAFTALCAVFALVVAVIYKRK